MARIEQILPISGAMDDNIDNEFLQSGKGVVRKRVNMRPDNIGDVLANVGIAGTELIDTVMPSGTNKTIGWCRDNENESIIYCVWNSNESHCTDK